MQVRSIWLSLRNIEMNFAEESICFKCLYHTDTHGIPAALWGNALHSLSCEDTKGGLFSWQVVALLWDCFPFTLQPANSHASVKFGPVCHLEGVKKYHKSFSGSMGDGRWVEQKQKCWFNTKSLPRCHCSISTATTQATLPFAGPGWDHLSWTLVLASCPTPSPPARWVCIFPELLSKEDLPDLFRFHTE